MSLFLVEIKKMLYTKTLVTFMLPLLLLPIIFSLICGGISSLYRSGLRENSVSLLSQFDNNIRNLQGELKEYENDKSTSARIDLIISYYQQKKEIHQNIIDALDEDNKEKYLDAIIREDTSSLNGLRAGFLHGVSRSELENNLKLNRYLQENKITPRLTPYDVNFVNQFTLFTKSIYQFLLPVLIILFATSFTDEFNNQTLKILCQQPYTRKKIYAAKYLSTCLIGIVTFLCSAAILYFMSCLFEGAGSYNYPVGEINAVSKEIVITNDIFIAKTSLYIIIYIFFLASVGLLVSIIVKNSITCNLICVLLAIMPAIARIPFTDIPNIVISQDYFVYIGLLLLIPVFLFVGGCWIFTRKDIFH